LTIDVLQGTDLTISGLPDGEVLLGPPSAPTALSVPVTIHRTS
jgi:hypothetical protein